MVRYLRAVTSFIVADKKGIGRLVSEGDLLPVDDPVMKGRAHLFVDLEEGVEQATASPGEKRSVRRPRTSTKS